MSDAHPSLAPQWLKSSSTFNLRPQTQTGVTTGTVDEGSRNSTWRESGSRLGLGAGAERESPSDSRSQTAPSRRDKASFPSSSRGYSTGVSERRPSYTRPSNPNPHRQLSDRELVEQMPAIKLRPGSRLSGDTFLDDSYKPASSQKDGDRAIRGRQQGNLRKLQVPHRPAAAGHPRLEKDFASLAKPPAQKISSGALQSPRQGGVDQLWTSRLADASPPSLQPAADGSPLGSTPTRADPPTKVAPRMADTILQAQAIAAQELEAAKSAKARKEQLALKQSKQLVPVLSSSKAKHASTTPSLERLQLTSLKKPLGLEPLGKIPVLAHNTRRDEDGAKTLASPGLQRASMAEQASTMSSPKATTFGGKPGRERDRMTFFSSLRRKTSGGEQHGQEENGSLHRQTSSTTSEAASVGELLSPKRAAFRNTELFYDKSAGNGMPETASNGRHEDEPKMTPEEIAFMRSLGWEDSDDDTGGGLTEEEVAAFKARQPPAKPLIAQKASSPMQQPQIQGNKFATTAETVTKKQELSRSFHSELEFSDSDSQ